MDVRAALHARLDQEHPDRDDTRFVDELGICGAVRVDVAVINGTLSGFELKSDQDTLRRLANQIDYYGRVLDRATLVVGERHRDRAVAELPSWWGVIVAIEAGRTTTLHDERRAHWNTNVDPHSLVKLLWREEVLDELMVRGLDRGLRSKPRHILWQRLADEVPTADLRDLVRHRLKVRTGWRSR